MNLFETPLQPSTLKSGAVVYYADAHTKASESLHGLQVARVVVSTDKSFVLDNGKKFNPDNGFEVTRGLPGFLYPYNCTTQAMVKDAVDKLFLINEVLSIDFNSLTTQQLSMIRDVARGAFTQIKSPSPCGGCSDTVEVAGINIELEQNLEGLAAFYGTRKPDSELDDIEAELASQDLLAKHPSPDINTTLSNATYALTETELDDTDDEDEDADDEDDDLYEADQDPLED